MKKNDYFYGECTDLTHDGQGVVKIDNFTYFVKGMLTAESNYTYLETLPNIDINIKCGNSLLHRFALTDSIQTVLRESSISISQYKEAVAKYKNAQSKSEKQDLETFITEIKSKLKTEINRRDARLVRLNKRRSELANLQAPQLFEQTKKEKKASDKRIADLKKEIATLENIFGKVSK